MSNNVISKDKELCCGCEACSNICPKNIISMKEDEEGFFYPSIGDESKCINCGRCLSVCPVNNYRENRVHFSDSFAGWAKDENEVISSSSGGLAAVIGKYAIEHNAIVYGVKYTHDFTQAVYTRIIDLNNINTIKGSKYIQARKHDIFVSIREDIKNHKVFFFGTPCDCYALIRFLKTTENITIISLICHGPTSYLVQEHYLQHIQSKGVKPIVDFTVRYKKDGNWKPYYIRADCANGETYFEKFNDSFYNFAFQYLKRPSCGVCKFKKNRFCGDVLLGDYHGVDRNSKIYNKSGVSVALPLSDNGRKLINELSNYMIMDRVPLRTAISQRAIHTPIKHSLDRSIFFRTMASEGLETACKLECISKEIMKEKEKQGYIFTRLKKMAWILFRI